MCEFVYMFYFSSLRIKKCVRKREDIEYRTESRRIKSNSRSFLQKKNVCEPSIPLINSKDETFNIISQKKSESSQRERRRLFKSKIDDDLFFRKKKSLRPFSVTPHTLFSMSFSYFKILKIFQRNSKI